MLVKSFNNNNKLYIMFSVGKTLVMKKVQFTLQLWTFNLNYKPLLYFFLSFTFGCTWCFMCVYVPL